MCMYHLCDLSPESRQCILNLWSCHLLTWQSKKARLHWPKCSRQSRSGRSTGPVCSKLIGLPIGWMAKFLVQVFLELPKQSLLHGDSANGILELHVAHSLQEHWLLESIGKAVNFFVFISHLRWTWGRCAKLSKELQHDNRRWLPREACLLPRKVIVFSMGLHLI